MNNLVRQSLLTIAGAVIHQDADGRYCLNDLHKAAGGENKHRPSLWLTNKQTVELIEELSKAGIPAIQSKQQLGTFVAKELVYAYAMWISPSFHLKVIRAYDAMVTAPAIDPMQALNDPATMRGLLLSYSEKVLALESANEEMRPKVAALDRISTANGSLCVTDAAKTLQVGPKWLFQFLLQNKWTYRRPMGSGWLAHQDKMRQGLLEHKATTGERPDGSAWADTQVRVTPKGLAKLSELIGGEESAA